MTRDRVAAAALAALALLPAACGGQHGAAGAAAWLLRRQQTDGSWRSDNYAVLRSGQALTPFVLHALLGSPRSASGHDAAIARGLAFVRRSIDPDGAVGYGDRDVLEYPVYATALSILVLAAVDDAADRARIAAMARWLAAQQCGEARGFAPAHPAYGAFGFGARGLEPGDAGHVDLSHTRWALQALARAGAADAGTRARAAVLLGRLQSADGGFHFSPVVEGANKAGRDADGCRAYATATADGLLALQAIGASDDDARVLRARAWLARHATPEHIGGIPATAVEPWHEALRFYHAMVLAATVPARRPAIHAMLGVHQHRDGSFRCPLVTAMKEDDPVLATALALAAFTMH